MLLNIAKHILFQNAFSPSDLILHVTSKCNARCQTCFNWKNLNGEEEDLSLSEYERISKQIGRLLWLSISGGEPFLRDDLPDICEIFCRNTKPLWLGISTNGFLPEKIYTLCEKILKRITIPLIIDISLDDLYEAHDRIKGIEGSFEKAAQTYKVLVKLMQKFSHLSVKIITVVNNKNIDHLEKINNFVRNKMKDACFHSNIFLRGNPPEKRIYLPNLSELQKKKEFLAKCCRNYRGNNKLSWWERKFAVIVRQRLLYLNLEILRERRQVIPCLAGKYHLVISADGNVSFCELLGSIGSLRRVDFDLKKLRLSKRAKEMRMFITNKSCFCTHECVQLINIIFNWRVWFLLFLSLTKNLLIGLGFKQYLIKTFNFKRENVKS